MCGPECLARVCEHYGIKTTPKEIARLAGTTAEGTTMLGLAQAAETKGLQAKGMLLGWQELRDLPKPSILWTPARHYLVLEDVEGRDAT
jgi:ABC-type bacteriocin/lantibiotic exporter with double-glycine peptidase domain